MRRRVAPEPCRCAENAREAQGRVHADVALSFSDRVDPYAVLLFRLSFHLLERALASDEGGGDEAERQADAWRSLAMRWASDEGDEDEVAAIYRQRTVGREVSW